jgi:hypothetical protein
MIKAKSKLIGCRYPQQLILELVNCKCKKGCESRRCSCFKASLKCTDLCQCIDCQNSKSGEEDIESDSDTFSSCDDFSSDDNSDTEP